MVRTTGIYEGSLRCKATHGPSQSSIETDAPVDNHGKGEKFSPTDLVGASMGTCMLTVMGIQAEKHGLEMDGATFEVEKEMTTSPRRIGSLKLKITMPKAFAESDQKRLEAAAMACPVKRSLHPDVECNVEFVWPLA